MAYLWYWYLCWYWSDLTGTGGTEKAPVNAGAPACWRPKDCSCVCTPRSDQIDICPRRPLRAPGKGRARANLGDTMYTSIGVADLGGRILKWPKNDEKL